MGQLRIWRRPERLFCSRIQHCSSGLTLTLSAQNNYRITAFTNGNADINGLSLQLDHIQDPTLRPLDELLTDHFMQGLFKYMKGPGEPGWTYEDYDDAFGDGSNLSNHRIWGTREGKERFELALADRLFHHRILQEQV
jgi:hypothetical protein